MSPPNMHDRVEAISLAIVKARGTDDEKRLFIKEVPRFLGDKFEAAFCVEDVYQLEISVGAKAAVFDRRNSGPFVDWREVGKRLQQIVDKLGGRFAGEVPPGVRQDARAGGIMSLKAGVALDGVGRPK